jgi:hypothetical protein
MKVNNNKYLKIISHPKKSTLIIFGILSMIILTLYVWNSSFAWEFAFGVTHYIVFLMIILIIGVFSSVYIDKKHKTELKYYFIIPLSQLLIIWALSTPIRDWQIKKSKENGVKITELIDSYKLQNGKYPKSLFELEEKLNLNIPKRTKIGTKFLYKVYEDGSYSFGFKSYYGYNLNYNTLNKKWYITD